MGSSNSERFLKGGSVLRGKTELQLVSCIYLTWLRMPRWLVKAFLGVSKCFFVSSSFKDLLTEGLVDLAPSTMHGLKATGLGVG